MGNKGRGAGVGTGFGVMAEAQMDSRSQPLAGSILVSVLAWPGYVGTWWSKPVGLCIHIGAEREQRKQAWRQDRSTNLPGHTFLCCASLAFASCFWSS